MKALTVWLAMWARNNWRTTSRKPIHNKDILIRIADLLKSRSNVKIDWVKAHQKKTTGSILATGNSEADKLAVAGAKKK